MIFVFYLRTTLGRWEALSLLQESPLCVVVVVPDDGLLVVQALVVEDAENFLKVAALSVTAVVILH